jgi:signal transduction histidine kinase
VLSTSVWAFGRQAQLAERRGEQAQREAAAKAVQVERIGLARELHDAVSGAVTAMHLQAAAAQAMVGRQDGELRTTLALIQEEGWQAMVELNRLLRLLRSVDPDTEQATTGQPGLNELPALLRQSRAAGLDLEYETNGQPAPLNRTVDLTAYRIVQEALTNSAKHGGPVARVRVVLSWRDQALTITVRDTPGTAPRYALGRTLATSTGVGLVGLAERVHLLDGKFLAQSDEEGFLVRAELPISADTEQGVASAARVGPK